MDGILTLEQSKEHPAENANLADADSVATSPVQGLFSDSLKSLIGLVSAEGIEPST